MPTCTRGTTKKTVSGTVKIKFAGRTIQTVPLTNEEGSEQWDTCRCEQGTYQENVCITATDNTQGESVRGSHRPDPLLPITIEWDLTVDTEREITNCEYECVTSQKGQYF